MPYSSDWKENAIEQSDFIADVWEICTVWAGKIALPVLALCAFASVYESFPTSNVTEGFRSNLMLVQVIALDMGGLGFLAIGIHLNKLKKHKSAYTAFGVAGLLLLIMISSVGLSVAPSIWPNTPGIKENTKMAENFLIFIRIAVSVMYGFLFHLIKGVNEEEKPAANVPAQTVIDDLTKTITDLRAEVATLSRRPVPVINYEELIEAILPEIARMLPTNTAEISEVEQRIRIEIQERFEHLNRQVITPVIREENAGLFHPELPRQLRQVITPRITSGNSDPISEGNITVITPQIRAEIQPQIEREIPRQIHREIRAEIPQEKEANWEGAAAHFPRVIEWQSAGLKSVSIEEITEVTGWSIRKINGAQLPGVRGGNKRIENVLDWMAKNPRKSTPKSGTELPVELDPEFSIELPRITGALNNDNYDPNYPSELEANSDPNSQGNYAGNSAHNYGQDMAIIELGGSR